MTEIREKRYAGVEISHPSIVAAIKNMEKQGKSVGEIVRVVGMPAEVVKRHAPTARTDR